MCGIFGYIGSRNASQVVINGLKDLEYRGYDSWGIAVMGNPCLKIIKEVGEISNAVIPEIKGRVAMGHTRWATHGLVNEKNAHPHTNTTNNIAVVHNGIIENYTQLKTELEKKGYKFNSDTDTEVIVQLIDYYKKKDLITAVKKALKRIEGSYALAVMTIDEPDKIILARHRSPLVIGLANNEFFFASDINPFLNYTNKVVYLEDNDLAEITNNDFKIYLNNKPINREVMKIDWLKQQTSKQGYAHYMLKEIMQQPKTLLDGLKQDKEKILEIAKEVKKKKEIFMIAAGTSFHAGKILEYKLAKQGIVVHRVLASEFTHFKELVNKDSIIFVISQSGETADLTDALYQVKAKKPKIIAMVNVKGSTLSRMAEKTLLIKSGPEIGVAATKSYINQVAVIDLISESIKKGKAGYKKAMKKQKKTAKLIEKTINDNEELMKKLALKYKDEKSAYFLGRGLNYPTALEGALKLKEISYMHAEGFAGGELKHGALALIEVGVPVITIIEEDDSYEEMISNTKETKVRGASIIGLSTKEEEVYDYFIKIPSKGDFQILSIIPMQLLAYYAAIYRGNNPDKPRNLAKSVTVK